MSTQPAPSSPANFRDGLHHRIEKLSVLAQTEDFDAFCESVFEEMVSISAAHGALLWLCDYHRRDAGLRRSHAVGLSNHPFAELITDDDNALHTQAVAEVIAKQNSAVYHSDSFTQLIDPINADSINSDRQEPFLLLFAPIFDRANRCRGTLELIQRADVEEAAQKGYLRFLNQIAQLFHRWFLNQELTSLTQHTERWHQKLDFLHEIHRSIDPTETAYAIANETRRLLNCDRVSVAHWNRRRCKIIAVSGQDRFDNRANVIQKLNSLATSCVSANLPLWITGDTEGIAPRVAKQIDQFLDEAHSRTLIVLPITTKADGTNPTDSLDNPLAKFRKLGAIIIEYFDADVREPEIAESRDLIVKESTTALENARIHGDVFMLALWKRVGRLQRLLFGDHLTKTLTALAALFILTLFLIFFPKELKMKVDGVLHPTNRKTIFSQTEGIIREVAIDEHSRVEKDQLLLKLENPDLDLQITDAELRLETIQHQIEAITFTLGGSKIEPKDKIELGNNLELLLQRQKNLRGQLELMKQKQSLQTITSPINGTVITSQTRRRLQNFPATPNLAVLEIAQLDGPWQLELSIPQTKLGYIIKAIEDTPEQRPKVEFRIGTNPNLSFEGALISVASKAIPSQTGVTEFRAIVEIDSEQFKDFEAELRVGTGATAKVLCGTHSLGFVCFYQIIDWFRTRVLF